MSSDKLAHLLAAREKLTTRLGIANLELDAVKLRVDNIDSPYPMWDRMSLWGEEVLPLWEEIVKLEQQISKLDGEIGSLEDSAQHRRSTRLTRKNGRN